MIFINISYDRYNGVVNSHGGIQIHWKIQTAMTGRLQLFKHIYILIDTNKEIKHKYYNEYSALDILYIFTYYLLPIKKFIVY